MNDNTATCEGHELVRAPHPVSTGSAGTLRPVERRVLRWVASGADDAEIARRFGRSTRWVAQVRWVAHARLLADPDRATTYLPARAAGRSRIPHDRLRPIERCLIRWRDQGLDYDELSTRFRRSPGFLARVEQYARYKLASA